jgi:hypothetical protein
LSDQILSGISKTLRRLILRAPSATPARSQSVSTSHADARNAHHLAEAARFGAVSQQSLINPIFIPKNVQVEAA